VEKGERRAQTDAQLLTDSAHRYSVPVMQKDHLGDQLIAEQAAGQHAGRSCLDEAVTARAVFPLESVNDPLGPQGLRVEDRARTKSPSLQRAATVRTALPEQSRFTVMGLGHIDGGPPVSCMARPSAAHLPSLLFRAVGLEGATGRRGRGAKRSLFGLALAVVQLLLQAANFFLELIDAALFLEAVRAEI